MLAQYFGSNCGRSSRSTEKLEVWRQAHVLNENASIALSMKYSTFPIGLLMAYCDEEPKRFPKFGGLVRISATTCRKIRGALYLEEIQFVIELSLVTAVMLIHFS